MPHTADCLFMIDSLKINEKRVVLLYWPQRTLPATTPLNGSYLMNRPLCIHRRSKPRFCGIFGSFGNLRHLPILACQGPLQVADVPALQGDACNKRARPVIMSTLAMGVGICCPSLSVGAQQTAAFAHRRPLLVRGGVY